MFRDRGPSIFPRPASAWWIPILLLIGWGPLYILDLVQFRDWNMAEGFSMPWGMAVAFPCTFLAGLSAPVQAFRLFMYFLNRPGRISK